MTDQEIAQALERLIREDAKRPPEEQVRDLIEAGVIDKQGRILIGGGRNTKQGRRNDPPNGQEDLSLGQKAAGK